MIRQHFVERGGRVVPHRHVQRLRRDVFFSAIGDRAFDARRDRLDDRGMEESCFGGACQLVGQRLGLFGGDVETKDLDGDQPVARGLVGTEHRSERAHADLMQHPEGAERGRRGECGRIVSGQLRDSSGRIEKM